MDKSQVCFIRARQKNDYVVPGIQKSGYRVILPYKDKNIFLRLCRELWSRLRLPRISIWYNSETQNIEQPIIIVKDPIITVDFMRTLRQSNPKHYIVFDYDNRVARSIKPESVRPFVNEIWSYDEDDCKKYGLREKGHAYLDVYRIKPNLKRKYDVFYVGRDKGRIEQIHEIERKLQNQGLKTYFHICADREFLTWIKKEYKRFLPYESYLELLKDSSAILNVVPEGQRSITQREMETVFDGVKCITNNRGILNFELYDKSRYFLLDDNYEDIPEFLSVPFKPIDDEKLEMFKFSNSIDRLLKHLQ